MSLNVSAHLSYDKESLIHLSNIAITEVQKLDSYEAPENCKWHVKKSYTHLYAARKYIFDDDLYNSKFQLIMADKSLKDIRYEGQ